MAPTESIPILIKNLEAEIPGTNLEDLKISYAKDYLAYKENGVLKVYNLIQKKVVFEKKPQAGSDKNMGVLNFQWLPDRDTLVYFYSRKNPNPITEVVVPVTPAESQKTAEESSTPKQTQTNPTGTKTTEPNLVEDPNQSPTKPATQIPETKKPETRIEKRYNNPQITELFTLELLPADEEGTKPDDRYNRSLDSFPAGGKINQMVMSTFTNLMYLTIQNGTNLQLMEIDIMKNVRTLNHSGELITQMVASDKFGTLYVKSKSGKTEQILALQGWEREIISKDADDVILGDRAGKLYLGKIQENQLVNVRRASDTSDKKSLTFETIWEGSIPFKDPKGVIIGANNEVITYDNKTAYIIENGKEQKINLSGDENFISPDGVQLIQLAKIGMSTKVNLQPLQ